MKDFKYIIKLLRPKQWIKNFFVFGAVIFSNNIINFGVAKSNILTFIAFCLISSTVYILNDIVDVERDRKHPKKCERPIASGKVSVTKAIIIGIILAILSLFIAINLKKLIFIIIILYLVNNIIYSFKIKNIILLDVFCISIGFILRLLAGGIATGVETSKWIILCTLFLSLFLGFGKRRNEVIILGEGANEHRKNLSQYTVELLNQLINISLTCTIMSYAIYSILGSVSENFIWTSIFVIFGVLRYYYLMYSKGEGGSPTELVLKDKQLGGCIMFWVCTCIVILNIY
ncbi:decaprenyl-phosphate phosphoribosyltransferase [Clostridium gasigenes]|uniref:UbiA prenyltransferase family protein n=1 Tax=Clostridium gasigenes TaxID=94869 RepID=A0A1H0LZ37_9CLOT|nr:decaprenyl-phosphate phosphoribosyltransferase [Clostridium gasigenes]MBB6622326.1 decaprenyl-phosphate phosphoribosyltransferase [Clostridium gasigenes]SDO73236.1 UbiA prenyltransferase family protein [Clostridium gasigenes]